MKKIAYPGTFNPFHNGHKHIVETLARMFDEVHILVFDNSNKKIELKKELRSSAIKEVFNAKNIFVHSCSSSLEDELNMLNIEVVARGIRNSQDLNEELQRSTMLKQISKIDTIFVPTSKENVFISSSIIRELIYLNKNIENFVPTSIQQLYKR